MLTDMQERRERPLTLLPQTECRMRNQVRYTHLSADQLERYALNQVRGVELETLEEHLLICEYCQQRQEDTDDFVRLMKRTLAVAR